MKKPRGMVARAYKRLGDWRILLLLLLLIPLFSVLFARSLGGLEELGLRDRSHLRMQLQRTADEWREVWKDYRGDLEQGFHEYGMHLLRIDLVFPVIYVLAAMSAIALLTRQAGTEASKWHLLLFTLPVLGGAFDWAENFMHISLLQRVGTLDEFSLQSVRLGVPRSFVLTVLKYALAFGPVVTALVIKLYRVFFRMVTRS